ncbi:glutaredoxin family protein [Prochlorococcus marinus]|uniref:glutaredoxin family protein n=1 Tax=Prochlorococcus marinus TaxID=1219 RepID=UPI0022B450B0|nr:glutaredoxin family protein [Prochlorococcus marinus]
MNSETLILYSRKGCCLCQAVENKLSNICLKNLKPSIVLYIIDIDSKKVSLDIKMKYTNEVPVVVLDSNRLSKKIELPRVPPRLKEDMLLSWIQKNLNILYKTS